MIAVDIPVQCQCGHVRGLAREVSPRTVNNSVCYCHDCRAFSLWLGRGELLDPHGGAPIVQLARSRLEITAGFDQVLCMRLSPKGMHRWYAACCRTPLGNTLPSIPFVGLARSTLQIAEADLLPRLGPVMFAQANEAPGGRPPGTRLSVRRLLHVLRLIAAWLLRGRGHPTPFFDRHNRPVKPPQVLTSSEREALRARDAARA
jgi:hypothetical protein